MEQQAKQQINYKNSKLIVYEEKGQILTKRIVFFGISWPIFWLIYLCNKKQFSLVVVSSIILLSLYYVCILDIYNKNVFNLKLFWIFYFVFTSFVLSFTSSFLFVRKKYDQNIKYVNSSKVMPVYKQNFESGLEDINSFTKILIVPYRSENINDLEDHTDGYHYTYNIKFSYLTFTLDRNEAIKTAKKLIESSTEKLIIDIDMKFYNKKAKEIEIQTNNQRFKHSFLKYLTCYISLINSDNKKTSITCYFEDYDEYRAYINALSPSNSAFVGFYDIILQTILMWF